jgi:pimeloyl-ACP methyl ester carboxylesterase
MRPRVLLLAPALCLSFACRAPEPATGPEPEASTGAPASEPAASARHFVGTLVIPSDPPKSIDWLIRNEPGDAKLWIPEQNVDALAASAVEIDESGASVLSWETLKITWTIAADGQSCAFSQAGATVECDVEEIDAEEFAEYTARDRPQHPEPPFPYAVEELKIPNPEAEGVTLAATLTLPEGEGPHPAVVLVSGSGAQDRDETIFGHKPFLVLADHLTRAGVAVIRYDDRGWAESSGDPNGTSADFASDALAVLRSAAARPEIATDRVGIIGHSEGAMIAGMLAAQHGDELAFIVMLAGPGVVGHELLAHQSELAMRLEESDEAKIEADSELLAKVYELIARDGDEAPEKIKALWREAKGDDPGLDPLLALAANEWMQFFLAYDPGPDLAKVRCPVLALIGTTDIQVDDEQNLPAIAAALKKARNKDATVLARPGLNHLFQHSETGSPKDYESITETFDPETLELIAKWLHEHAGA